MGWKGWNKAGTQQGVSTRPVTTSRLSGFCPISGRSSDLPDKRPVYREDCRPPSLLAGWTDRRPALWLDGRGHTAGQGAGWKDRPFLPHGWKIVVRESSHTLTSMVSPLCGSACVGLASDWSSTKPNLPAAIAHIESDVERTSRSSIHPMLQLLKMDGWMEPPSIFGPSRPGLLSRGHRSCGTVFNMV